MNSEPRATAREWIGLAVLALPTLLLALDLSVLYLALPQLGADLRPSSTQTLWIMDIYGFMIAGFLITMGTLGDRIGRRRLLLIGASAFAVASVLAAYSTSPEMLIAARAALGVAGATLMPSTLALISNMFRNPRQRAVAIAGWLSCFVVGTAIGPVVGGLLLENFWWGSAFLLGVPVMALLLVTAPALLPEYRDAGAGRLDLTSVALSLAAILPVIYALKEVAKDGVAPVPVLAMLAGLGFGVAFVRRQRRLASPLVDLRLFAQPSFAATLGIMLLGTAAMGGIFLFGTQYLQLVEGLSPLRAGVWLVAPALASFAGSMLAPPLAQRMPPGAVVGAALAISVLGYLVLTRVDPGGGPAPAVIGLAVVFLGGGMWGVVGTDLVVGSAPPEKAGSASSLSESGTELGIALGVAALGSVGTAVYRNHIAGSIPTGVPAEHAEAAHDTLAGAAAAATHLPDDLGAALLGPARDAFTTAFNTVAGLSAVMVAVIAVLAVSLLRRRPDPIEAAEVPKEPART